MSDITFHDGRTTLTRKRIREMYDPHDLATTLLDGIEKLETMAEELQAQLDDVRDEINRYNSTDIGAFCTVHNIEAITGDKSDG